MDGVNSTTEVRNTHVECKIEFVYSIAINDDMCTYSTGVFKVPDNERILTISRNPHCIRNLKL